MKNLLNLQQQQKKVHLRSSRIVITRKNDQDMDLKHLYLKGPSIKK